jgi:hypothetical protein
MFLPAAIVLLGVISMPVVAIAQPNTASKRAESRPDNCGSRNGEYTCNFNGAEGGNTVMSVYPASIKRAAESSADFQYISSSRGVKTSAQVNCRESLDHWHAFTDASHSEQGDVSTYATHRMLNYICEKAGHSVGEQINR